MSDIARLPVTMRRNQVQRQLSMNRAAVAAAWMDMEVAAARTEVNVKRVALWVRRASGLAAMYATWRAFRRMPSAGMARKAVQMILASRGIGRMIDAMKRQRRAG